MRTLPLITLTLLCAALVPAEAQVYKWKDANGQLHYADVPGAEGAQQIRGPSGPASTDNAAPRAPAPAPAPPPATAATAGAPAPTREQVQAVQNERAKLMAERCQQARDAYDKAMRAMRIYRTNDKGEREFVSTAEADTMRAQLRAERDSACGG